MALGAVVEVTVATRDVAESVRFAGEAFGWQVVASGPGWAVVGASPDGDGRVRFVEVEAGEDTPHPRFRDPGPRMLGIYSTDLRRTERLVTAAGGRVGPVAAFDAGFDEPMEERLAWGTGADDLIWTIPDYEPRLPTPVIEADPSRPHGELHSAVLNVTDTDAALDLLVGAGGMTVVFDGVMGSEQIERMLDLPPGARLRNVVLGGEGLPPGRLELVEVFDAGDDVRPQRGAGITRLLMAADDVAADGARLADAGAAQVGPDVYAGPAGVEIALVPAASTAAAAGAGQARNGV